MSANLKKIAVLIVIILFIVVASAGFLYSIKTPEKETDLPDERPILAEGLACVYKNFSFSQPEIEDYGDYVVVNIMEANFQSKGDGRPVVPVKLNTINFPFGTKIISVEYEYSKPEEISIPKKISYSSCSTLTAEDEDIYENDSMYPSSFVSYHVGGGLLKDEYKTFFNLRVNPITYFPTEDKINYVKEVKVRVIYKEPETPILQDKNEKDLLIISPEKFTRALKPLVNHKEKNEIKTKLVSVEDIYKDSEGRDKAEKIKYYIKKSIEELGIKSVLLIGGKDRQSTKWNTPVRYSHVLIREGTQENLEPSFLSDLYFADIYDSEGNFSSWDTNNNDIFAEFENGEIDRMDLYPDVRFGRLPCRNRREVRIIVDKIIDYENMKPRDWFKNIILVSGDHWLEPEKISEGILIMEKTKEIMSDFKPVELYATEENTLLVRDVNKALNQGAGFAYFSGHGSSTAWGIHYPDDKGFAPSLTKFKKITFYNTIYMKFLINFKKLPVTVVGGCFNGKFDISLIEKLKRGKIDVSTNCWAWELASLRRGGSIATIANTGLGTHALGDSDYNDINDYLEIYDGFLELKFFKLYSEENINVLGNLHQGAITNYLNTFLGNKDEMDTKMVQQWELFGDPSLEIKVN